MPSVATLLLHNAAISKTQSAIQGELKRGLKSTKHRNPNSTMPLKDLAKQQFGQNRIKAMSTKKGPRTPHLADKHGGESFTFTPKATGERANKQDLHLLNQKVRASIKPEANCWWEARPAKGLV